MLQIAVFHVSWAHQTLQVLCFFAFAASSVLWASGKCQRTATLYSLLNRQNAANIACFAFSTCSVLWASGKRQNIADDKISYVALITYCEDCVFRMQILRCFAFHAVAKHCKRRICLRSQPLLCFEHPGRVKIIQVITVRAFWAHVRYCEYYLFRMQILRFVVFFVLLQTLQVLRFCSRSQHCPRFEHLWSVKHTWDYSIRFWTCR